MNKALLILFALTVTACGPSRNATPVVPDGTQLRPIDTVPTQVEADTLTVKTFRSVCDQLARSLVVQDFVSRSSRPPVVTIRKLENKTGLDLDKRIFQETIRARLMEYAGGSVLFRDDQSYKDIIEERLRQSNNEVTVTMTDSTVTTKSRDRVKERQFDKGFLSGSFGDDADTAHVEDEREVQMEQSASVSGGVAPADYFLRGIIYQMKERDVYTPTEGMNYFQFQFRMVDARNGLIVWEKMLDSKKEGEFRALSGASGPPAVGTPPVGAAGGTPPAAGAPAAGGSAKAGSTTTTGAVANTAASAAKSASDLNSAAQDVKSSADSIKSLIDVGKSVADML